IPFKIYDFQEQYRQRVVDYMIDEYKAGRTPNPDIMCNQEVKFKLFLETALADGADMIATGHYARISDSGNNKSQAPNNKQIQNSNDQNPKQASVIPAQAGIQSNSLSEASQKSLLTAQDKNKDQTYFLYRVKKEALSKTLFPLGAMTKPEVREKAK